MGQRPLLRHALDAVDAVVSNLGPLPAPMAAMLFQNEMKQDSSPVLNFNAKLTCPKIGLVLAVGGDKNPLSAPLPDKSFGALEALLTDVSCVLGSSGSYILNRWPCFMLCVCFKWQTCAQHLWILIYNILFCFALETTFD